MTHASLFSGIGGAEVAATMMGWENIFHCEINPFCRRVLEYWYPNSKSYEDITKTNFEEWRCKVDVLTGGFPCQPFSYAGQRRGADDDRYLWPHMLRAIQECRPTWVIGENVGGIATMVEQSEIIEVGVQASLFGEENTLRSYELRQRFTLERVCSDLEHIGYSVQPILIPACAVGAPHRRDRIFIVAHNTNANHASRETRGLQETEGQERLSQRNEVRKSRKSSDVRRPSADSDQLRCGLGEVHQPQHIGLAGNIGTTSHDGQVRPTPSDTDITRPRTSGEGGAAQGIGSHKHAESSQRSAETQRSDGLPQLQRTDPNTNSSVREGWNQEGVDLSDNQERQGTETLVEAERGRTLADFGLGQRWQTFPSISPIHRGNDGIPFDVDGLAIPFNKWRQEALKAYGNAIVPQVMYEIFLAIDQVKE